MASAARRVTVFMTACAMLCACGGGGGGASPSSPPASAGTGGTGATPTPPATPAPPPPPPVPVPVPAANAFLPTDTRIELTYAGQTAPARFEATFQHNGNAVAAFRYPIGGKEYYVSTPDS